MEEQGRPAAAHWRGRRGPAVLEGQQNHGAGSRAKVEHVRPTIKSDVCLIFRPGAKGGSLLHRLNVGLWAPGVAGPFWELPEEF